MGRENRAPLVHLNSGDSYGKAWEVLLRKTTIYNITVPLQLNLSDVFAVVDTAAKVTVVSQ